VVGGLLVAVAAVGVFSAYSASTAPPATRYVVAARDLSPGQRVEAADVEVVGLNLPDAQRQRAFEDIAPLIDATVVEPLLAGELVQEGSLVATGGVLGGRSLSFAVDPAHAVNAVLKPAERVDILATFGAGDQACTHVVATDVPLIAVNEEPGAVVGQAAGVTVTVSASSAQEAVAITHAANAATVTLVRATDASSGDAKRVCTPAARPSGD
jgi:Flp pilus assembly protein CpaB